MTLVVAGTRSSSTTSTRTDQPSSSRRTPVVATGSMVVSSANCVSAARTALTIPPLFPPLCSPSSDTATHFDRLLDHSWPYPRSQSGNETRTDRANGSASIAGQRYTVAGPRLWLKGCVGHADDPLSAQRTGRRRIVGGDGDRFVTHGDNRVLDGLPRCPSARPRDRRPRPVGVRGRDLALPRSGHRRGLPDLGPHPRVP